MAQVKNIYVAADGTQFDSEQAADAHDQYLESAGHIEAYIQSAGLEKAQAGLMRKHLAGYLAFAQSNPDASAETPAERAAAEKAAAKEAAKAKRAAEKAAEAAVKAAAPVEA